MSEGGAGLDTPAPLAHWAALGALLCAFGVALGAYASHGVSGADQVRLQSASWYLLVHGLGLITLPRDRLNRPIRIARFGLVAGCLLFCGSLIAAVFFGASTRLAPIGGSLLIGSWLLLAWGLLRWR